MIRKVLIIHSFRDEGAEARIAAANNAPEFHDRDLRHICIFDAQRAPDAMARLDATFADAMAHDMPQKDRDKRIDDARIALIKDDFLIALRHMVSDQVTELGLFHAGTVFTAYTGPILQGTIELNREFPQLRWALEDQRDWLQQHIKRADRLWGFAAKAASAQIKHISRTFAQGDEVDRLLRAAFG